jgi:hypothetical protein
MWTTEPQHQHSSVPDTLKKLSHLNIFTSIHCTELRLHFKESTEGVKRARDTFLIEKNTILLINGRHISTVFLYSLGYYYFMKI